MAATCTFVNPQLSSATSLGGGIPTFAVNPGNTHYLQASGSFTNHHGKQCGFPTTALEVFGAHNVMTPYVAVPHHHHHHHRGHHTKTCPPITAHPSEWIGWPGPDKVATFTSFSCPDLVYNQMPTGTYKFWFSAATGPPCATETFVLTTTTSMTDYVISTVFGTTTVAPQVSGAPVVTMTNFGPTVTAINTVTTSVTPSNALPTSSPVTVTQASTVTVWKTGPAATTTTVPQVATVFTEGSAGSQNGPMTILSTLYSLFTTTFLNTNVPTTITVPTLGTSLIISCHPSAASPSKAISTVPTSSLSSVASPSDKSSLPQSSPSPTTTGPSPTDKAVLSISLTTVLTVQTWVSNWDSRLQYLTLSFPTVLPVPNVPYLSTDLGIPLVSSTSIPGFPNPVVITSLLTVPVRTMLSTLAPTTIVVQNTIVTAVTNGEPYAYPSLRTSVLGGTYGIPWSISTTTIQPPMTGLVGTYTTALTQMASVTIDPVIATWISSDRSFTDISSGYTPMITIAPIIYPSNSPSTEGRPSFTTYLTTIVHKTSSISTLKVSMTSVDPAHTDVYATYVTSLVGTPAVVYPTMITTVLGASTTRFATVATSTMPDGETALVPTNFESTYQLITTTLPAIVTSFIGTSSVTVPTSLTRNLPSGALVPIPPGFMATTAVPTLEPITSILSIPVIAPTMTSLPPEAYTAFMGGSSVIVVPAMGTTTYLDKDYRTVTSRFPTFTTEGLPPGNSFTEIILGTTVPITSAGVSTVATSFYTSILGNPPVSMLTVSLISYSAVTTWMNTDTPTVVGGETLLTGTTQFTGFVGTEPIVIPTTVRTATIMPLQTFTGQGVVTSLTMVPIVATVKSTNSAVDPATASLAHSDTSSSAVSSEVPGILMPTSVIIGTTVSIPHLSTWTTAVIVPTTTFIPSSLLASMSISIEPPPTEPGIVVPTSVVIPSFLTLMGKTFSSYITVPTTTLIPSSVLGPLGISTPGWVYTSTLAVPTMLPSGTTWLPSTVLVPTLFTIPGSTTPSNTKPPVTITPTPPGSALTSTIIYVSSMWEGSSLLPTIITKESVITVATLPPMTGSSLKISIDSGISNALPNSAAPTYAIPTTIVYPAPTSQRPVVLPTSVPLVKSTKLSEDPGTAKSATASTKASSLASSAQSRVATAREYKDDDFPTTLIVPTVTKSGTKIVASTEAVKTKATVTSQVISAVSSVKSGVVSSAQASASDLVQPSIDTIPGWISLRTVVLPTVVTEGSSVSTGNFTTTTMLTVPTPTTMVTSTLITAGPFSFMTTYPVTLTMTGPDSVLSSVKTATTSMLFPSTVIIPTTITQGGKPVATAVMSIIGVSSQPQKLESSTTSSAVQTAISTVTINGPPPGYVFPTTVVFPTLVTEGTSVFASTISFPTMLTVPTQVSDAASPAVSSVATDPGYGSMIHVTMVPLGTTVVPSLVTVASSAVYTSSPRVVVAPAYVFPTTVVIQTMITQGLSIFPTAVSLTTLLTLQTQAASVPTSGVSSAHNQPAYAVPSIVSLSTVISQDPVNTVTIGTIITLPTKALSSAQSMGPVVVIPSVITTNSFLLLTTYTIPIQGPSSVASSAKPSDPIIVKPTVVVSSVASSSTTMVVPSKVTSVVGVSSSNGLIIPAATLVTIPAKVTSLVGSSVTTISSQLTGLVRSTLVTIPTQVTSAVGSSLTASSIDIIRALTSTFIVVPTQVTSTLGTSVVIVSSQVTTILGGATSAAPSIISSAASSLSPPTCSSTATTTNPKCPGDDGADYTATGGTVLKITCLADQQGGQIGVVWVQSFGSCLDTCATTTGCKSVSYTGQSGSGFCYLKAESGSATKSPSVWGAVVVAPCESVVSSVTSGVSSGASSTAPIAVTTILPPTSKTLPPAFSSFKPLVDSNIPSGPTSLVSTTATTVPPILTSGVSSVASSSAPIAVTTILPPTSKTLPPAFSSFKPLVDSNIPSGPTSLVSTTVSTSPAPVVSSGTLSCPDSNGVKYTVPGGDTYTIQCYADHLDSDLGSVLETSLDNCLAACDRTTRCAAVSWVPGNPGPCYLKSKARPAVTNGVWGAVKSGLKPESSCPHDDGTSGIGTASGSVVPTAPGSVVPTAPGYAVTTEIAHLKKRDELNDAFTLPIVSGLTAGFPPVVLPTIGLPSIQLPSVVLPTLALPTFGLTTWMIPTLITIPFPTIAPYMPTCTSPDYVYPPYPTVTVISGISTSIVTVTATSGGGAPAAASTPTVLVPGPTITSTITSTITIQPATKPFTSTILSGTATITKTTNPATATITIPTTTTITTPHPTLPPITSVITKASAVVVTQFSAGNTVTMKLITSIVTFGTCDGNAGYGLPARVSSIAAPTNLSTSTKTTASVELGGWK